MENSTRLHTEQDSGFNQTLSQLNEEELKAVVETIVEQKPDLILKSIEKNPEIVTSCIENHPEVVEKCIKNNPVLLEDPIRKLSIDKPEIFENAVYQNVDLTELDKIKALLGLDDPELAFKDESEEEDYFKRSRITALERDVQGLKNKTEAIFLKGSASLDHQACQLYTELLNRGNGKNVFMRTDDVLRFFDMKDNQSNSRRARRIMDRTAAVYPDVETKMSRKSKVVEYIPKQSNLDNVVQTNVDSLSRLEPKVR